MAHGAFDTVGGMRAGFPLVIDRLVAGGTGIPGWNQPMEDMRGLILLSNGRLDGNSQNEKNEQGESRTCAHRNDSRTDLLSTVFKYRIRRWLPISDTHHVSPECDLRTGCEAVCERNVVWPFRSQECRRLSPGLVLSATMTFVPPRLAILLASARLRTYPKARKALFAHRAQSFFCCRRGCGAQPSAPPCGSGREVKVL